MPVHRFVPMPMHMQVFSRAVAVRCANGWIEVVWFQNATDQHALDEGG
ncbi:hypothetical protein [Hydrogenophaga sp.]|nr:hypothetical protein [Hydrogenophaga sp.]MDO8904697.1 hypothetical protein [Hydrogenophaga sp.]